MIDGDELERSYKHHLSDYAEWEQRDHASNWMLIEDNLGENLSIDETMLQLSQAGLTIGNERIAR
ncbi:MAG: hypothetical protein IJE43_04725 [Alphaproteobacteria bacterium]|jgi:hypothetical protein|nr:hypothetical protein [Alphaproteobacteria bacterium]